MERSLFALRRLTVEDWQSARAAYAEFARVASDNILRRPVGAANVAEAVVYLLGARSITGQTLYVDCGQRFVKRDGDVMFDGRDG